MVRDQLRIRSSGDQVEWKADTANLTLERQVTPRKDLGVDGERPYSYLTARKIASLESGHSFLTTGTDSKSWSGQLCSPDSWNQTTLLDGIAENVVAPDNMERQLTAGTDRIWRVNPIGDGTWLETRRA